MTYAYDPIYLEQAMRTMAGMLDYAVLDLKMNLTEFYHLFLSTGVADRFGQGEADLLVGKSGAELAAVVLEQAFGTYKTGIWTQRNARTPEYWTGWALSRFQWESGHSFSQIDRLVPIDEAFDLYMPYHEMDVRQFCDHMRQTMEARASETTLKRLRSYANLTQRALADQTGIPIRTIQQYEQRQKDISKASGQYLRKFASALNCRMEDLLT